MTVDIRHKNYCWCSQTVKYTEIKFYYRPVRCEMNTEAGLGEIGEIYTAARRDR